MQTKQEFIVSEEMSKRIITMMKRTYQQIGCDLPKKMKGTEVREVVADCDYMKVYGNDKEALEFFESIPRDGQDKLLKLAFPNKRYDA